MSAYGMPRVFGKMGEKQLNYDKMKECFLVQKCQNGACKHAFTIYPVRNNAPLLCSGVVGSISELFQWGINPRWNYSKI